MRYYKPQIGNSLNYSSTYTNGLLAAWLFNEMKGSVVKDSSLNKLNRYGVLSNFALSGTSSNWVGGNRLNFDGTNDMVSIQSFTPGSYITDKFTLSCLVRPLANPNVKWLAGSGNTGFFGFGLGYGDGAGTFFHLRMGNGASAAYIASNNFAVGTWCRVVGTYDGVNGKIYVNGKLNNSAAFSGNISFALFNVFNIGQIGDINVSRYFNGDISEVLLYNRALTHNEILRHHINPFAMII